MVRTHHPYMILHQYNIFGISIPNYLNTIYEKKKYTAFAVGYYLIFVMITPVL